MVLTYLSYATGVFHVTWATRSPFTGLALFFAIHVPLLWGLYGSGSVTLFEYMVLYPLVAAAAALLGFLYSLRMNIGALVRWFAPPCADGSHRAQWRSVCRHAFFIALLIVAPALPLELYRSNTFVGGLVSLLVAVLAHVVYWTATRCDVYLGDDPVGRRTFSIWCSVLDVVLLRLAYTLISMTWSDFLYTAWPFYVMLASLVIAIGPVLLLLEFGFLRRGDAARCGCGASPCQCAARRAVLYSQPPAPADGVAYVVAFGTQERVERSVPVITATPLTLAELSRLKSV